MIRLLSKMGWRNLWRNKRRTLIMLGALSVGVWAMIWMNAMMRGMLDQMIDDSIDNLSGHIQVHAKNFLNDPSINNSLDASHTDWVNELNHHNIVAWAMRLRLPAMISSERHSLPVTVVGIDPRSEAGMSFIMKTGIDGKMLADMNDNGIVIGQRLLEKLETDLGKRIVIMTQDSHNELADRGFRIRGVYSAKLKLLESQYVFVGLHTLQSMLDCENCISEISLKTTHYLELEGLKQQVMPIADGKEVHTWYELDPYTESMLNTMDGFILVFIVIIFLALSFGLVNTLVMAIFERGREIALLHALGLSPRYIALQILLEAIFLIIIGLVLGNLLAYATLWPFREGIDISIVGEGLDFAGISSVLRPSLRMFDVLMANFTVMILGMLACLLPAWRAAQKAPAAALNWSDT